MRHHVVVGYVVVCSFVVAGIVSVSGHSAAAASPPVGFTETTIATNIQNPVGMEVDPDGRLFVLAGNSRRIELFDDSGYLGIFLPLPQAANLGSGLLGLAFAPDFASSGDVYVSYVTNPTVVSGPQRFRLSRFASDGDVADPGSETVLFEVVDIDPTQQQHQGGDIGFGPDGKLYWALGDRVKGTLVSQSSNSLFGKVLRLDPDGGIPSDNPFYDSLQGEFRAIYGNGLRNPYRMERHPSTGELYMSEVGPTDWEEIDQVERGANYGWPLVSGVVGNPAYTDPIHAYPHDPDGCAITGGSFYEADVQPFPAEYRGDFFYGDHCFGWIAHLDMTTGEDTRFMTGADRLVEVKVNPRTGALYYLDREYAGDTVGNSGGIGRIDFAGSSTELTITRQPADVSAAVGEHVTFDVQASGRAPLGYQWYDGAAAPVGENSSVLDLGAVQASDDGAQFYVVVTDADGAQLTSDSATLTVSANTAPVPVITAPDTALRYIAGQRYVFAGSATDAEDGALSPAALSWDIVFHHGVHTHPFISDLAGVDAGTFDIPANDETDPDVYFRISLTATDSDGSSRTVYQDVLPLHVQITLDADPSSLPVLLDGAPVTTPATFTAVAGVARTLEAPGQQSLGGGAFAFAGWSDGGGRQHQITTPTQDTTFTAVYEPVLTDLPPTVSVQAPTGGSSVAAPATISGTATDDLGVTGVQVIIKRAGTSQYWNGTTFVSGWRALDAAVVAPGDRSANWSLGFSPPSTTAVRITVRAIDSGGQRSANVSRNATITVGTVGTAPTITLDSPSHRATSANPVSFAGTVSDDGLSTVTMIIKRRGTSQYWNGTAWQSGWTQVPVDEVTGGAWSYTMSLPTPVDVVAFARATGLGGLRSQTAKVVVFVV